MFRMEAVLLDSRHLYVLDTSLYILDAVAYFWSLARLGTAPSKVLLRRKRTRRSV
jgi:hypothetical protein